MRFLKQCSEVDMQERFRQTKEQTKKQIVTDRFRQLGVLDAIGEKTDVLVEPALEALEPMEKEKKEEFLRSVFRRLVLQALHTAGSFDHDADELGDVLRDLGADSMFYYGSGLAAIGAPGNMVGVVINESLHKIPHPEDDL